MAMAASTIFQVSKSLTRDIDGAARDLFYAVTYLELLDWLRLFQ